MPETIGHVLNACTPHVGQMRTRHNAILERVRKAIPSSSGTLLIDQKVPGSNCQLRPDIVLLDNKKVLIADLTIPYESGPDAFQKARNEKRAKYAELVEWARSHYDEVHFDSLVVGSLGSWDPDNEQLLKQLNIGSKYSVLFRKLCCLDAIKGSLDIWRSHCGDH